MSHKKKQGVGQNKNFGKSQVRLNKSVFFSSSLKSQPL